MIHKTVLAKIARHEICPVSALTQRLAQGTVAIPYNIIHKPSKPMAVGKGLTTKINVNIGTSTCRGTPATELKKLRLAVELGADAVMDLSIGKNIAALQKTIVSESPIPVGTVPIYEAAVCAEQEGNDFFRADKEFFFDVLARQARRGVDFFTIHCGITKEGIRRLRRSRRIMEIVSRGGSLIASWMMHNGQENPFYEHFDRVVKIAKEYNIALSLGDGFRPGSVFDATDRAQIQELVVLGELAAYARREKVHIMIEGPGHVPLPEIEANMKVQKSLCNDAPFYVLGPLVTDAGLGFDHITAAIGGALAGYHGADFLCYVTASEHLGLPDLTDIKEAIIAAKIAAHAADIAKKHPKALARDRAVSQARRKLDWRTQIRHCLFPEEAMRKRTKTGLINEKDCTMCGKYCAIKTTTEGLKILTRKK
jgi:phosphomethylpyrimidine synthase